MANNKKNERGRPLSRVKNGPKQCVSELTGRPRSETYHFEWRLCLPLATENGRDGLLLLLAVVAVVGPLREHAEGGGGGASDA